MEKLMTAAHRNAMGRLSRRLFSPVMPPLRRAAALKLFRLPSVSATPQQRPPHSLLFQDESKKRCDDRFR